MYPPYRWAALPAPPTSSGPSCFFPDRVPATSRAGPASERRQVDPLKVEDGYAATRASVFDRTTAGYLSRAVRCVRTRQRQDPVRSGLAIERAIRPGSPRNVRPVQGAGPGAGDRAVFHGGYWQSRDKSQFRFMAGAWAKAGFNVALAGYRLCRHLRARSHCKHPGSAIGRRPRLAGPQRNLPIILAGHSAGAHLAIELALAWKTRNPATATLAGVVAISGIYDLTPLVPTTLNERLRLDLSQARQCSPIFRVQGGISPRHSWSAARKPQPSCGKAGKWRNTGPRMAIRHLQALYGQDHFSVLAMLTADHGPLAEQALAFISRPG